MLLSSGGGGGWGRGGRQAGKKPLTWGLKNKGQGFLYLGQSPWPGSSLDGHRDVGPREAREPLCCGTTGLWTKGISRWQPEKLLPHFLCP